MLLKVIDGEGVLQTVVVAGDSETVVDHSCLIITTDTPQEVLAANEDRSGYYIQVVDTSGVNVYVNDLGVDASDTVSADNGSVVLSSGRSFPHPGYPLSKEAVSVFGPAGTQLTIREW